MSTKYGNTKTMVYGILFDSKAEASRYMQLRALEAAGEITGLQTQVKFELIPKMAGERACFYVSDFTYIDESGYGKQVVEDVKSRPTKTREYIIKRKLLLWRHNIRITEVMT